MARGNFGERLKRERELREVTLEEITSATRIGPRFLEALENEDWEKLPGGVFNRGFVRSIARYLGLDEEALLGEYDMAHGTQVAAAEEPTEKGIPSPPAWFPIAVALGALLLLAAIITGGVYAWKYFRSRRSAERAPLSAPALPRSLPEAALPIMQTSAEVPVARSSGPIVPDAGPMDLLVSASAATHLLVLSDGHVAFYDEVHAGESRHFAGNDGFEVTASDSGAVLLELNGVAMPPLGVPGSSGTIKLSREDLRQAPGGNSKR